MNASLILSGLNIVMYCFFLYSLTLCFTLTTPSLSDISSRVAKISPMRSSAHRLPLAEAAELRRFQPKSTPLNIMRLMGLFTSVKVSWCYGQIRSAFAANLFVINFLAMPNCSNNNFLIVYLIDYFIVSNS